MMPKLDGLSTALQGLAKQEQRVAQAAEDINTALVAAQNQLAAGTGRGEALPAEVAVEDGVASETVNAANTDLARPIVDLLQAKAAYNANLKAVEVTADVERDLVDAIGKRRVDV